MPRQGIRTRRAEYKPSGGVHTYHHVDDDNDEQTLLIINIIIITQLPFIIILMPYLVTYILSSIYNLHYVE